MPTGKALQDLKTMLANLGGSRVGKTQKISAELMRRKLAYLVGQNVDCMPSNLCSLTLFPLTISYLLYRVLGSNVLTVSQYEAGFIKFQALYRGFAVRQKYKKMSMCICLPFYLSVWLLLFLFLFFVFCFLLIFVVKLVIWHIENGLRRRY